MSNTSYTPLPTQPLSNHSNYPVNGRNLCSSLCSDIFDINNTRLSILLAIFSFSFQKIQIIISMEYFLCRFNTIKDKNEKCTYYTSAFDYVKCNLRINFKLLLLNLVHSLVTLTLWALSFHSTSQPPGVSLLCICSFIYLLFLFFFQIRSQVVSLRRLKEGRFVKLTIVLLRQYTYKLLVQ